MESIKEEQAGQGLNPFQEKSSSDLKTAESTTSAATRKEKKENGNAKNGDKDSLQNQITPKRRRSMTVKLMRRVSTSAIMKSPSSLTNEGDDNSGGDVADGRKSKDKNKVPVVDVTITTPDNDTPTSTSQPMSTPKRNFFRTMSQSAIKRGNQEKRKSKRLNSNVDQISPSKISVPPPQVDQPEESIEPDYSDVVEEIRKTPKNTKLSAPSRPQMDIEYGKADIDTREYAHDIIIQEIERGFFLGPALRAVYEGNDHEKFLERLDCRIKQHDRDIERMCNFHYQGFIESITELINVRSDAEKLKSQTLVINKELQESGKEVARKSDDLIQCQLQQRNVASAIEKLSECLPVLQMYAKMMEQMRAGRYYSALKTLEQLEHTALPSVYRYRFCEIMLENIPKIREEIKGVSMSELKDFLEKVRQNSDKIGMVAMKQVEKERNLEQSAVSGDRSDSFGVKSSSEEESPAEADLPRIRAKPINKNSKIPSKTRTNVRAEALNSNHSASPQHRQRLNPFDEIEDEVEEVMDSRNPFDDPNPFTQEPSKSKVTENGLANPFLDENEDVVKTHDVNPFFDTDNAFKEPTTPDALKDMNYENEVAVNAIDSQVSNQLSKNDFSSGSSDPFESKSQPIDVVASKNKSVIGKLQDPFNPFVDNEEPRDVEQRISQIEREVDAKNVVNSNAESIPSASSTSSTIVETDPENTRLDPARNAENDQKPRDVSQNLDHMQDPDIPVKAPPRRKKKKLAGKPQYASKEAHKPPENPTKESEESNGTPSSASVSSTDKVELTQKSSGERIAPDRPHDHSPITPSEVINSATSVSKPSSQSQEFEKNQQGSNVATLPINFVGHSRKIEKNLQVYHNQRARLVEDMVSSKWRKIRDWQMPRIYNDLSASDLVDFSPVYKCLHIFGLVGSQTQFENYYRTQRRNQARLVLQPSVSMQDNPDAYRNFFHQIVGFFVVEDHVLHTAPNLISRQWINDLWEMAISKLIAGLRTDSGYCSDAVVMMKVKNLIVIFADTLKAYGFSVGRLFSLLMEMRDQYGEILLKHWAQKFNDIFNEDNYTPMLIESDMETQALLNIFPHEDPNFDQAKYPRKLPFSKFVPRIYNEIKNFILACLKYCEDLHLSSTEVDDMIRKSANLLLTRTLASGLQLLVAKRSLGLAELVQIIVNTTYLENSCRYIEDFVQSITGVRAGSAHSAKLVGVSTFKDARNETETQIYNKLNSKIDEFFELAEYAWDVKEPKGMASRYLLDLIAFLRHNFEVFTNLPPKVAQTACMSACQHISARMMELVMDPDVKTVTLAALQQFSLDVMQCELFSNSDPVPGFQDGALQMTFVEIRQLLDLFLSWDWSSYLADYGNGNSKYLRVNPGTALTLLEKIKEERGHRNIFTSLSKQEREKKKLLETVVRQLRGIVNDGVRPAPRKRSRLRSWKKR
ncbi:exocyst complex component 6B-like isoform X2 [Clavelina lepadiformis]|uniref:exocyst complex component 6B-like isoform X2 n=1 Tax=Clavelina lepadiformis TaxID=159417 RepID=UPI00404132B4